MVKRISTLPSQTQKFNSANPSARVDIPPDEGSLHHGESRICPHCLRFLLITEFRRRSRQGAARMSKCRECHNRAERERRAAQRHREQQRSLGKALTRLGNEQDAKRAALLLRSIVGQFGGLEHLALLWRQNYEHSQPGSYRRFRSLQALVTLAGAADTVPPEDDDPLDPTKMSEPELLDSLDDQMKRMIAERPEIAVAAAADIGWCVIPPRE